MHLHAGQLRLPMKLNLGLTMSAARGDLLPLNLLFKYAPLALMQLLTSVALSGTFSDAPAHDKVAVNEMTSSVVMH